VIGTALTIAATSWLAVAEWIGARRQQFVAKPLASLGFLLVPVLEGLSDSSMARWLAAGLVLGAIGDILLMFGGSAAFAAGLGSFLLGHIAYVIGFSRGSAFALRPTAIAAVVMIAVSILTVRWLRPHLERPFDVAVPLYVIVISVMVTVAFGARDVTTGARLGAALFAASDLTVARERFVESDRWNRVIGLPTYYLAQLLIAWSVVGR
jgi:uncharacterized membrane protein YhhN